MSEVIHQLLPDPADSNNTPPLVLLGQFERVGSTFYLDQLEKTRLAHNEPYKMLVPNSWPIAKGYDGALISIDEFFDDPGRSSLDKHWLRNFVASLHYPQEQVVKETNLYLALPQFLELFPHSNIELLTRNPLGIISSFKRNNLFERWHYQNVADTLSRQLEATHPQNHEAMSGMIKQGRDWSEKLSWMIGLNAVLLSRHVAVDRVTNIISYEDDVVPAGAAQPLSDRRTEDSIFSTNLHKTHDDFETRLTNSELGGIYEAMSRCIRYVRQEFDDSDQVWFDKLYAQHLETAKSQSKTSIGQSLGSVSAATAVSEQSIIEVPSKQIERKLVKLKPDSTLVWDHSLVTNAQMGTFLQELIKSGQDPSLNYFLLLDNMPPSRGGRITFDRQSQSYRATEGFDNHPAYWITWLSASLYAYGEGMRLPTYKEWHDVYEQLDKGAIDSRRANHSYAHDDTIPTGNGPDIIPDDFFGNLRIWCADWSSESNVSKSLAGISWKHHLHENYMTKTERPYLTNSRVIGARLVCCGECPAPQKRSTNDVITKLGEITKLISDTSVTALHELSKLNQDISNIITPQPCEHSRNNLQPNIRH